MNQTIPKGGLVVSCQALPDEPLYGSDYMVAMAKAALEGGAVGIRANGVADIKAIRKHISLPIIGLVKRNIESSPVYITPTLQDAFDLADAGADIIAIDGTTKIRPDGVSLNETIHAIHQKGVKVMCDISTLEEGVYASLAGADYISTTLSGFTKQSRRLSEPDFQLIHELVQNVSQPVAAEGRIWTPEQAVKALEFGAQFVVVGTAITRPQLITSRFVEGIENWKSKHSMDGYEKTSGL